MVATEEKRTVLVVDDSELIRAMLTGILRDAGYEIAEAGNGKEALQQISRQTPNMLITDLNMPEMNGIELIKEVRKDSRNRFMPIVMLTTEEDEEIKKEGRAAGVSGWIITPFKPENLLAVVNMVAR